MFRSATPEQGYKPTDLAWSLLRFAFKHAPLKFSIGGFVVRLSQHLVFYTAILFAALYICLFLAAPIEVFIASTIALALADGAILIASPSRQRLSRLAAQGGVAISYLAATTVILKLAEGRALQALLAAFPHLM